MAPEIQKGSAPSREIRNQVTADHHKAVPGVHGLPPAAESGRGRQLSSAMTAMVIRQPPYGAGLAEDQADHQRGQHKQRHKPEHDGDQPGSHAVIHYLLTPAKNVIELR